MTLLPASDFGITGHPGNAYPVNETCAHPTCGKPSAHGHHCWPRSYLRGQPYEWVRLEIGGDPVVIGNRLGFCVEHHEMLTGEIGGYRARLVWEGGIMFWEDKGARLSNGWGESTVEAIVNWQRVGPTSAQPPVAGQHDETHEELTEGEICPECGHHKKKTGALKPGKLRPTKEWTLLVPDDAEIGADILDGMIEDFAIPLGATEWSPRLKRYHVLVAVLAWANENRESFIADVAEALELRTKKVRYPNNVTELHD